MRTINVNVADQTYGNPPVSVNSLAIPQDNDVLVPVADQATPRADNDVGSVTTPRPVDVVVGEQAPASPSQNFGQIPGVAPLFLPFPPSKNDPNIQGQNLTAGNPAEFIVAGPDISIQTNLTDETERDYTVTAVFDADTGRAIVPPTPPVAGSFAAVADAGGGYITLISSVSFPPALANGEVLAITGSSVPGYNTSGKQIANLTNLSGTFAIAIAAGGSTTFSSNSALPVGLVDGKQVTISGSSVPSYNGTRAVTNVVSLSGSFTSVADAGAGNVTMVSPVPLPAGLAAGRLAVISGSSVAAYNGALVVANVVNLLGAFSTATDAGGGNVTLHSIGILPAGLASGQQVTISGAAHYDGTFAIANVTAHTFDITPLGGFVGTDAGNWAAYTFDVTPVGGFAGTATGNWGVNTFDMAVAFAGTANGSWSAYTFDIPGTFTATASGSWSYQPPTSLPPNRYKLIVDPPDLTSFGITLLGREMVFDDGIPTTADEGAARTISWFGSNYIIIDRTDLADLVPTLTNPQPGDSFTLDVRREGSEVVTATAGTAVNVNVSLL